MVINTEEDKVKKAVEAEAPENWCSDERLMELNDRLTRLIRRSELRRLQLALSHRAARDAMKKW